MVYFIFAAVAIGVLALMPRRASVGESRLPADVEEYIPEDEFDDMAALALADPLEALVRHGLPADAARLTEQGVDLAALGYRPDGR